MLPFSQAYDMPCILYYSINTALCNVRIQPQSLAQTEAAQAHTRNAAATYIHCAKTQNEPHETETVSNANCSNVRIVRTFNSFHTNNCFQFPTAKCYGSTTVLHSIKVKFRKTEKAKLVSLFLLSLVFTRYMHINDFRRTDPSYTQRTSHTMQSVLAIHQLGKCNFGISHRFDLTQTQQ